MDKIKRFQAIRPPTTQEFTYNNFSKSFSFSDKHHTVTSSTLLGPWKKKLVVQRSLFLWKVCGRFWCQKWNEVVWIDGRQSGVQKDRLVYFQWNNCSTELRLYTGFVRKWLPTPVAHKQTKDTTRCLYNKNGPASTQYFNSWHFKTFCLTSIPTSNYYMMWWITNEDYLLSWLYIEEGKTHWHCTMKQTK